MAGPELVDHEQATFLLNLVHDEYQECVIAGHEEDYDQWAAFAAQCIAKILLPEQPDGTVR